MTNHVAFTFSCQYHYTCGLQSVSSKTSTIGHTKYNKLWPLHTRDREPVTITLQALSLVEKVEPVQVHFTLRSRDRRSMWMPSGCKVYMNMASNGSCFTVTWTIIKTHLLEGTPNTKPGDRGTPKAHNHLVILFYHAWGPAWIKIHWIEFGWGPGHTWLHTTLEGTWPYYMILEVCWDGLWTLPFGLSQFHGHGLLAHVWSGPYLVWVGPLHYYSY